MRMLSTGAVLVQVNSLLAKVGRLGGLSLVLLLLAAGLQWGLADPWRDKTTALLKDAQQRRSALRPARVREIPQQDLSPQAWRAALPATSSRQQRLADLLEHGLRLGLSSTRTEHRVVVDHQAGLEQLRVSMPLKGSYAQIRQFIGEALLKDPGLSLDELRLSRSQVGSLELEAELQWTLHSRMEVRP